MNCRATSFSAPSSPDIPQYSRKSGQIMMKPSWISHSAEYTCVSPCAPPRPRSVYRLPCVSTVKFSRPMSARHAIVSVNQ